MREQTVGMRRGGNHAIVIRLMHTLRNINYLLSLITVISIIVHKLLRKEVINLLALAACHVEKSFSWLFTSTDGSFVYQ